MLLAEEILNKNEDVAIQQIVDFNLKTLFMRNGIVRRGQHATHHGCVRGSFHVLDDIPDNLRQGIFAKEASFDALVRFSNGMRRDDRKFDAHGMAIKLLNVEGRMLLDDRSKHQDFVLVDNPVYFTATLAEYEIFNRYFTRILDFSRHWRSFKGFLPRLLRLIHASLALRFLHRSLFSRATAFASRRISSPLSTDYFSTTPYLCGEGCAVKYFARSRQAALDCLVTEEDGLSNALRNQLSEGIALFDFGVCIQKDVRLHPIEDSTVDWAKNGAPCVNLAVLEILRQEVPNRDANGVAEYIAFSPWNSLSSHRPLGIVNRIRKQVYLIMADRRHRDNGIRDDLTTPMRSDGRDAVS